MGEPMSDITAIQHKLRRNPNRQPYGPMLFDGYRGAGVEALALHVDDWVRLGRPDEIVVRIELMEADRG